MMADSVEGMEALYGQAQGKSESSNISSVSSTLHPFLFSLVPQDPHLLRLCVSDFHAQTWQSDLSILQLQDLRDEVGIGGSWSDFLTYVRTALSSNNVKFLLGGPANAVGDHDAPSARVVAQKSKGTPRLSVPLTKLEGSEAEDIKASISLGLFEAFQAQSSALLSANAQGANLAVALAAEKAKVENLEEKTEASTPSFVSRRKLNKTRSSQLSFGAIGSQQSGLPLSQLETQVPAAPAETCSKGAATPKFSGMKSRVHVAPASRRAKRRGTAIGEETDT